VQRHKLTCGALCKRILSATWPPRIVCPQRPQDRGVVEYTQN